MICEIGVLGLGVMGSSLAENFIRNGFPTALYSREPFERDRFARRNLSGYVMTDSLSAFAASLQRPRRIVMMITAGPAVDAVKDAIAPYLEEGDILVDGGNS
ncbi:MAG: NADP-dependent phosphogluconate dehydrogenase, partial [Lachnospiraceae bacterium]|nr:NADP-dependent phosphogluconate dehydrogenase [Lachnospiraceae bacterium]